MRDGSRVGSGRMRARQIQLFRVVLPRLISAALLAGLSASASAQSLGPYRLAATPLTVQGMQELQDDLAKGKLLDSVAALARERLKTGEVLYLVHEQGWAVRSGPPIGNAAAERLFVDHHLKQIALLVDNPSGSWCDVHDPQQQARRGYTGCTSRMTRLGDLPSQRRHDGARLALVDTKALLAALEEARLLDFLQASASERDAERLKVREELEQSQARANQEARVAMAQRARDVETFRRKLAVETETNCGPVLELKGSLVKTYFPVREYGNEHWLRRAELFPPGYDCSFVNGNYRPPSP